MPKLKTKSLSTLLCSRARVLAYSLENSFFRPNQELLKLFKESGNHVINFSVLSAVRLDAGGPPEVQGHVREVLVLKKPQD